MRLNWRQGLLLCRYVNLLLTITLQVKPKQSRNTAMAAVRKSTTDVLIPLKAKKSTILHLPTKIASVLVYLTVNPNKDTYD